MARASGERAPAFTAQELEKLVDGVLPQYTVLYGPPNQQVSAYQKTDIWRAIAKEVRTLGVHQRQSTHCRKRWEDIRRWSKKTAEAQLGMAFQRGRGARRTMSPPDVPDPGGGLPRVGWALEGITAATRGPPPATRPSVPKKLFLSKLDLFPTTPPPIHKSRTSTSAKKSPVPVVPVRGMWSAPGTRAANVIWSHSTASPPPVKHQKLDSARRERGKTPAGKAAHKGPGGSVHSAVTPPKVVKGQKKSPKSGKSSTAEKTAIIPVAQEATTSPIVSGQEATARVSAQEGSPIVISQEATARVSAQEGSQIVSGQEATTRVSAQEGPGTHSPAGQ
ncbi:hypothetical protein NDU88_002930 [Pleurodeles waltl]|uniref:Myb/SANT-like DNA-binding domain-containing protein n=1 Tax=Pleurodeles waltl TaxID=8319 RepID=A0AAV7TM36_PLEWA|nr:hypothetical protein NDU88_002930 [Pleurodeles waltl]